MEVQTEAIRGSYVELVDAAEDINGIFKAFGENWLDLSPLTRSWLMEQLEAIEGVLIEQMSGEDALDRGRKDPAVRDAQASALLLIYDESAPSRLR